MRCLPLVALGALLLASSAVADGGAIFEPGSKPKVESAGGSGGEGPAWDPKLGLLTSGNGHV